MCVWVSVSIKIVNMVGRQAMVDDKKTIFFSSLNLMALNAFENVIEIRFITFLIKLVQLFTVHCSVGYELMNDKSYDNLTSLEDTDFYC